MVADKEVLGSDALQGRLSDRPFVNKSTNTVVRRDRFLYYRFHGEWF